MLDQLDCVIAVDLFHDVQLPIFIFFVLKNMFHGIYVAILDILDLHPSLIYLVDLAESATTCYLQYFITLIDLSFHFVLHLSFAKPHCYYIISALSPIDNSL